MAVNILKLSDFINSGEFSVGLNTNEHPNMTSTIERVEKKYLTDLLGARLYNALQTDLAINNDGTATAQKWIDFINGVTYTTVDNPDIDVNYEGVKRMLKALVFFYYLRDHVIKRTGAGTVQLFGENSENVPVNVANGIIESKYNIAIDLYHDAQCFIEEFQEDTFEYDGTGSGGPGVYEFDVIDGGLYIQLGDLFTTQGSEFETVFTDPSSVIGESTAGLSLEDDGIGIYEPFPDWVRTNKEPLLFV